MLVVNGALEVESLQTLEQICATLGTSLSYALLKPLHPVTKGIRLLGLTLSSLGEKSWKASPTQPDTLG
jgi:hypothetical protein